MQWSGVWRGAVVMVISVSEIYYVYRLVSLYAGDMGWASLGKDHIEKHFRAVRGVCRIYLDFFRGIF